MNFTIYINSYICHPQLETLSFVICFRFNSTQQELSQYMKFIGMRVVPSVENLLRNLRRILHNNFATDRHMIKYIVHDSIKDIQANNHFIYIFTTSLLQYQGICLSKLPLQKVVQNPGKIFGSLNPC